MPEFDTETEKYWLYMDTIRLLNAEGETIYEEDLATQTPSLVDSATTTISLPPRLYAYLTLTTECKDGQELSLQFHIQDDITSHFKVPLRDLYNSKCDLMVQPAAE